GSLSSVYYPLSLHAALPICPPPPGARRAPRCGGGSPRRSEDHGGSRARALGGGEPPHGRDVTRPARLLVPQPGSSRPGEGVVTGDRKSTRLNSSHGKISYVV